MSSSYEQGSVVEYVFVTRMNPFTGMKELVKIPKEYDLLQEVARSGFADMLHDYERNQKYHSAIKMAITKIHERGKKAHVLDIGTGTGLLSMMAARCGADSVVACEAFSPMAETAEKILTRNGFKDKIKLIPKRSNTLTVGENGDLTQKANILVTEIFDTELIGEGAIGIFNHAHKNLLEVDCLVVPMSGTLYCQIVESKLARKWNWLEPIHVTVNDRVYTVSTPPAIADCPGTVGVHDMQLSQFPQEEFKTIVSPRPVMRFDWSGQSHLPCELSEVLHLKAEQDGVAQIVFVWWDLTMDTEGEILLSCAPMWAHPLTSQGEDLNKLPWRDHWMQAVYYLPKEIPLKKEEKFTFTCSRDEYSFWFSATKTEFTSVVRPVCVCGLHIGFSHTRIGAMNDTQRIQKYVEVLEAHVKSDSVCLCLSDGSILGVVAAKLGAKKIYCLETEVSSRRVLGEYIEHNNLKNTITVVNSEDVIRRTNLEEEITLVIGEPHFSTAVLPWDNTYFWYMKSELSDLLSTSAAVVPLGCSIWGMAVEFDNFHKIKVPVHSVEGFSVQDFDELIEGASNLIDNAIEPYPLWEYISRPLTEPFKIMEFPFHQNFKDTREMEKRDHIDFEGSGTCHALVLWVDWDLDGNPKHTITTGPIEPVTIGKPVKWDMYTRQGVHFLKDVHCVEKKSDKFLSVLARYLPHNTQGLILKFECLKDQDSNFTVQS